MRTRFAPVLAAAGLLLASAFAQNVPHNRFACTLDMRVCAHGDVASNSTRVERSNGTRNVAVLWSVPTWLQVVRVSASGSAFLVETNRLNVLPADADADLVVLSLYSEQGAVRDFKLGDFLSDASEIRLARRAGSWARRQATTDDDVARYLLPTGRVIAIHLPTGQVSR